RVRSASRARARVRRQPARLLGPVCVASARRQSAGVPAGAGAIRTMSDIYGEGHGSAHDWKYCWSSWKTSYYQCARCGHKFAHAYDFIPDIFQAMKQQSVPAECQPTTLSPEDSQENENELLQHAFRDERPG